jgi:hypothetical protein
MRVRAVGLALTVVATALGTGVGHAGGCPLIVDARGDAHPVNPYDATPVDQALGATSADLLSTDIWVAGGRLNAVVRLPELPPAGTRPYGYGWSVGLRAEEGRLEMYVLESNGNYDVNSVFVHMTGDEQAGAGSPVNLHSAEATRTARALQISAPLDSFAPYTKVSKGTAWRPDVRSFIYRGPPSFGLGGYVYVGPGGVGSQADVAEGKRFVRVGSPDCVPKLQPGTRI